MQKTHLIKDSYQKYRKYSAIRKQTTQLKKGQKTQISASGKRIYVASKHMNRCSVSYAIMNCELKQHWDTTACLENGQSPEKLTPPAN